MKTYLECIPCFIRQTIEASNMATSDPKLHEKALRRILGWCKKMDLTKTPPEMAQRIHSLIKKMVHNPDPYRAVKKEYNQFVLSRYEELKKQITTAPDPLEMAVRLAIAGNIIDYGVCADMSSNLLDLTIKKTLEAEINQSTLESLRNKIEIAQKILYIGDNSGEIVFDRLLIEQFPAGKTTFVVRGEPIINDVTRKEALEVGMDKVASIIDTGWNGPGAVVSLCSKEFQTHFAEADLVIAKGQGNYETLNEETRSIFFILKVKCSMMAKHTEKIIGDLIFEEN